MRFQLNHFGILTSLAAW